MVWQAGLVVLVEGSRRLYNAQIVLSFIAVVFAVYDSQKRDHTTHKDIGGMGRNKAKWQRLVGAALVAELLTTTMTPAA